MEDYLYSGKTPTVDWTYSKHYSTTSFRKVIENSGGFTGKMMSRWKNQMDLLESKFEKSLALSAWECRDTLRNLSLNLLEQLRMLESRYTSSKYRDDDDKSAQVAFLDDWICTIREWKKRAFEVKCELRIYLTDQIKKHCHFLTNLKQFHPEYIKWKIARIIMETNKIILANEEAFEETETGLIGSASEVMRKKRGLTTMDISEPPETEHDVINLNYDDLDLEDDKLKKGEIVIEPLEEIRTDTTLTSMLDWLANLKDTLLLPLPKFQNYDHWNKNLQTALDHLDNCTNTVIQCGIEFLNVVEPHLRDEMLSIKQPKEDKISSEDRTVIERWIECISFFEFTMANTTNFINTGAAVWNKHVCRLETLRKIIQNILRELLVQQNYQQMKIEQKINILLDGIREASTRDEIDNNVKGINKFFMELEKLYEKTYESGLEEVKEFTTGCELAREVFRCEAAVCLAEQPEPCEFPDHGSDLDVTLDVIKDLHHWEVIKQTFKAYANWHTGLEEGINLLCQVEKQKASWEIQWKEGLTNNLGWIRDVKEQALNRRKERLQADIALPRIKELEAHSNVLRSHIMGVENIFSEKSEWLDNYKCCLLSIGDKLLREYNYLINYKNLDNIYSRNRLLSRINKFELELQRTDEVKEACLEETLLTIRKKFAWLQKANQRILTSIKLFNEGGSFSSVEALGFADKVRILQSDIQKEEKASTDAVMSITKAVNPIKNIDIKIFTGVKHMIHYKTKKESIEEMAEVILDKLQDIIRVELTSSRNFCIELCDVIGCAKAPLDSLQELLAKFALYLRFPTESSILECEDLNYMKDFSEDSYKLPDGLTTINESKIDEDNLEENVDEVKDCKTLLFEAAELEAAKGKKGLKGNKKEGKANEKGADDDQKKGSKKGKGKASNASSEEDVGGKKKRKTSKPGEQDGNKKKGKKTMGTDADDLNMGKKNVLRDTKCEQLKRDKQLKELEKERAERKSKGLSDGESDGGKKGSKKRPSKGRKKSSDTEKNKGKSGERKSHDSQRTHSQKAHRMSGSSHRKQPEGGREEAIVQLGNLVINFAGGFLFKYTSLPIEMPVCNYLLFTKKVIFEHFVQIQTVSEKFFTSDHSAEIKKAWLEFSPMDDFKRLTNNLLKRLRILNIHCEHSWIILAHDFLCMVRALHCVTEERVEIELNELEANWKLDFSRICCESEAALREAVNSKTLQAARLLNQLEITDCQKKVDSLHQDVSDHCNHHIEEIKTIWSGYTKGLSEKYLEYKDDMAALTERTEEIRKMLRSETTIVDQFTDLRTFAERFDSTIKLFLDSSLKESIDSDSYLYPDESVKSKDTEVVKLEMLQILIKAVVSMVENYEKNYLEIENDVVLEKLPMESEALKTSLVDINKRKNVFMQEIIKNIRMKHYCFRRVCTDQMRITTKWLDSWQNNNITETHVP